ncbi:hypothetical protein DPMN_041495 [Dreissena polymorpha]|uniref:Uncharacterized protein n=1 Tax=Dreissena polymorpha TaxID=45954 RepID=A0A9D4CZ54_DREPO|nr:hypothetical protein DPMN_041495 [Dreissena polymorpha]
MECLAVEDSETKRQQVQIGPSQRLKFGVAKTGEQCQKKNQNSKARSSSYALQSSERATTASSEEHMSVPVMKVEALSVKNVTLTKKNDKRSQADTLTKLTEKPMGNN